MTKNRPVISAIVCTHNRHRYLEGSIGSLRRQTLPTEDFEIVLVDNGSTDSTAAWCQKIASIVPNVHYVFEPVLGLNHARNAGWRAARGEFIAYLDDDAVADGKWLEVLIAKFHAHGERVAGVGGKVQPLWEAPPPSWLTPPLWSYLSVLDWGSDDIVLDDNKYFVGANMAFRRAALAQLGGFHGDLDRKGSNLLSNGEIHLKRLLEDAGYLTMYIPEAIAAHSVPAARMSKRWFRRRHYWQGVSDVVMERLAASPRPAGSRLRCVAHHTRTTATLLAKGLRQLPNWIFCGDSEAYFAWNYQLGRTMARWRELLGY